MNIQRALWPVICFGLLLGCVAVTSTQLGKPTSRAAVPTADVAIYRTAQQVPGKYEEIALLNASGDYDLTDESQMYSQMRKEAGKLGANGIILDSISEPTTGAKVAQFFVGTEADRKGKAIAIFIYPSATQSVSPNITSAPTAPLITPPNAQVVAMGPVNPNARHSPWVVETAFAPADPRLWVDEHWTPSEPKPWNKGAFTTVEYHDLGKYSCDGLFLRDNDRNGEWSSGLILKKKIKGDETQVEIEAHVTNPKTVHDKLVTLSFEVINGETVVGKATIRIKVGQDDESSKTAKLVLASSSLVYSPITKLRITMMTQDN